MKRNRAPRNESHERWVQLIGFAILGGMALGILINVMSRPIIYEAQAETVAPVVETRVMIEVLYADEDIKRNIREEFVEDPDTAVKVAWAESQYHKDAVNPEAHIGCHGSIGIFQIACVHNRRDPEALKDVMFNIKKAHQIYLSEGWYPWGVCHDGKVNCHLK